MSRLVFVKGEQRKFLQKVGCVLGLGSDELGKIVGISGRSFRDWVSEKVLGKKESLIFYP